MPKIGSLKKNVCIILRLEMILSVINYEIKDIFYQKNFKLTKNNTFKNVFCKRFFPNYRFLSIFYKLLDFYTLFFQIFSGEIFSTSLPF